MTTPQQTRVALAEIPGRLELLRVDNATNVALSQAALQTTSLPSPDELIIRQRGLKQRRLTIFSPEQQASPTTRSPFQKTPTKILTSSMILRSSPRKRLTMGSTPPDPLPPYQSPVKASATRQQQLWPGTPVTKKARVTATERPLAQMNQEVSLPVLLQAYTQQQLIEIIIGKIKTEDNINEEIFRSTLPLPDVEPLEQELQHFKRNIFKSLPTSRLSKKTDSSAFLRASVHLNEFKRLLTIQIKQLHDSGHWDALIDYIIVAWPCVSSTPVWESVSHNVIRKQCFKILACHCISAIKNGAEKLGTIRLNNLECLLKKWSRDYEDIITCTNALNKVLGKMRNSL